MNMHQQWNDATQANLGFVIKQTSHIEQQVYRHRYPDVDYASIIPVDTSANEFATTVTYFSMDKAGRAKWMNNNAKDVPTVGLNMEKHETAVHFAGIGYDFGWGEVGQARLLGIALQPEKAMAARRSYEEFVYELAVNGDTEKSFEGLFSYTGVTAASATADGTGSSALWSTKTPDQIIRDVNDHLTGVHTATNTVAMADTLLMPYERFNSVASLRLTDTNMTILEFIRQNNVYTANTGQPLSIRGMRGLSTKGAGSTARMVAYRRSPEVLKLHIPMPHRFLPVQQDGLQYIVPGVFSLGGLDIRLPKEVRYLDGI